MSAEEIKAAPDRDLIEYFAGLFKHLNRGIKGRGKGRNVKTLMENNEHSNVGGYPMQQQHVPHLPHPGHHALPPPLSSSYNSNNNYNMPRNGPYNMMIPRDPRGVCYGFDVDQESMVSSATSGSPGTIYEEDHSRELAFSDRMY
jgi:hypothetical protein